MLALTCHIELFTQAHYRESIEPDAALSPLFKDVFLYHWKEESQHAILDELEWTRERRQARRRAERDARGRRLHRARRRASTASCRRRPRPTPATSCALGERPLRREQVERRVGRRAARLPLAVHRLGAQHPRFLKLLTGMITPAQVERVMKALAPLMA